MKFATSININNSSHKRISAEEAVKLGMLEVMQRHIHTDNKPVELRPVGEEHYTGLDEIVAKSTTEKTDEGFHVKYTNDATEIGFQCSCDRFLFLKFFGDGKAEMEVKQGYSTANSANSKYSNKEYEIPSPDKYNRGQSSGYRE